MIKKGKTKEALSSIFKVVITMLLLLQIMPDVSITTEAKNIENTNEQFVEQVEYSYEDLIHLQNIRMPRAGGMDAEVPPLISAVKMEDAVGLLTAGAALDAAGGVWMWGYNAYGVQGLGIAQGAGGTARYNGGFKRVDYFVQNEIKIVKIWGAFHTMYALSDKGDLYAWGYGGSGQMGNGTTTAENSTPVKVSFPAGEKIKEIYVSNRYADAYSAIYAIAESGKVYFWGYASYRTTGSVNPYASADTTSTPVEVSVLTTLNSASEIVSIGPGARHSIFVTKDGKVYAWGDNGQGQLGISSVTTYKNTLTEITHFSSNNIKIVDTSVYNNTTLVLSDTGDIYQFGDIWGSSVYYAGAANYIRTPSKVQIDATSANYTPVFTQIEAGYTTYLAVDQHGRVWSWGSNAYYQFGSDGSLMGTDGSAFDYTNLLKGKFNHTLKVATQIPNVLGDGDTQMYGSMHYGGSNAKAPVFSGVSASNVTSTLNNALRNYQNTGMWSDVAAGDGKHPTIYDKKYYVTNKEPASISAAQPTAAQMRAAHADVYMMDAEGNRLVYVVRKEAAGTLSGNFYIAEESYNGGWFVDNRTSTGLPAGVKDITSVPLVKDSEKDWIELATGGEANDFTGTQNASLPYMHVLSAGKETVIYLDKSGNIYVTALTGSGGVAWGWDYVDAYDWTGSTHNYGDGNGIVARHDKDGLFDYYNYEIMYQRGMPRLMPMYSTMESTKEKIYMTEDNTQVDTLTVTTKLPPIFNDDDLNLTYTPELRSIKYIVIPYDLDDDNFSADITPELFETLYASGAYEIGELIDTPIKAVENSSEVEHTIEITDNSRIVAMVTGFSYSAETKTITSHYADNFYTPVKITHSGNGYVDGSIYEEIYSESSDNVVKTMTTNDPTDSGGIYGFPLDAHGNVIEDATFGYDMVTVSKYDVLPNNQDKYWQLMSGEEATVSFTLDKNEPDILANLEYDHEFKYERNPLGWVTITYEGYYYGTETPAVGFVMDPNPEIVKKDIEITRTPTTITNHDNLGYYVDSGTVLNSLVAGNLVFTPTTNAIIKFQYATHQSNGEKEVLDDNDNGYAEPGELLHYTLTYTNEGYGVYKDLEVKDELEGIADYIEDLSSVVVNVTHADETTSEKTIAQLQAGFNAGDVPAGKSVIVTFSLKLKTDIDVSEVDKLSNTATLGDTNPSVDIDTGEYDLDGSKVVSDENGDKLASPEETLTYTIRVENNGTIDATDVKIQDTLASLGTNVSYSDSAEVTIVNTSTGATAQSATIATLKSGITIPLIEAGAYVTVTFEVVVSASLDVSDVTSLTNNATIDDEPVTSTIDTGDQDLTGTKAVSKATAAPGDTLTYTLVLKNEGAVKAENQTIQDTLVDVLPYIVESASEITVTVSSNKDSTKNGTVTGTNLISGLTYDVLAGEIITVTFDVTIKAKADLDLTNPITIENSAVVGEDNPSTETELESADVTGTKTVSKAVAAPGENLTYTLTLTNSGNATSEDQTIKDTLVDVLPYIVESASEITVTVSSNKDSTKNGTVSGTELISGLTYDVLAGEIITVTFDVTIKAKADLDLTDSITIENSAVVGESNPSTETEVESTDVIGTKAVSKAVAAPGDTLTYTLTLKNEGNITSENQTIKDTLVDVLPYIVESASEITVTVNSNKDTAKNGTVNGTELISGLTYNVAAGEIITVTFDVTVKDKEDLDLTNPITIENSAVVGESNPGTETELESADVTGTKTVSKETVAPGDTLTYTLTLTNSGNVKAENETIKDTLVDVLPYIVESAGEIEVVVSSNKDTSKNATITATELIAGLTYDVAASETITVTFDVTIKAKADLDLTNPITIENSAVVGKDNPGTETELESTDVTGTKTVSKETAAPGDTLTYTLTLKNEGNIASENQAIKDTLVDVLPYIVESASEITVTVSSNKDSAKNGTVSGTELISGLTYNVAAGEIITVTFNVTIKDKEDLDLTSPITIENSAVVGGNNPGTETEVESTDVTGTKAVSKETAAPGDTLTYTLTLSNSGNITSENQTIKDTLVGVLPYIVESAGEIEVVVSSNKDTSKNATITATELIAGLTYNVAAGETIVVTFDVTIKAKTDLDLTNPITIENSAVAGESNPSTETEVESTDVTGIKTVSKTTAAPGDTLTYTLTLTNSGNVKSENQTIKDTLIDVLPYIVETASQIVVAVSSTEDVSKNATITGTELIAGLTYDVLAGEVITVTFDVTIKAKADLDLTNPITIENSAVVGESSPSTETEVEATDVTGTKTVSKETAAPGDTLTYTLTLTNSGNIKSENQTIKDTLVDVLPYIVETAGEIEVVVASNKDTSKNATITATELISGLTYDVLAGEIITVTFDVTIKDKEDLDLTSPITIENSAVVGGNSPSTETEVESTDVTGTKTVSKETATPGDTLTYTLTLSNTGNTKSEDQMIKDTLIGVLPYIVESASEISVVVTSNKDTAKNATVSGTELISGLTYDVLAGEIITVTFDVTIKAKTDLDLTNPITIENSAVVGESSPGTETEVESADVTGTKTVSKAVAAPGDTLTYTLTLTNSGNAKAESQTIKDTLVDVLPYIVETATEINVVVASNKDSAKNATITGTELIAGLTYDVLAGEVITVTFDVTIKDKEDLDFTDSVIIENSAVVGEDSPSTETEVKYLELVGTKSVSDENGDTLASPGEKLTYTIRVDNNGTLAGTNVKIQDTLTSLGANVTYNDTDVVTIVNTSNGATIQTATIATLKTGITIPTIEVGAYVTVSFTVTVSASLDVSDVTSLTNNATVNDEPVTSTIDTGDQDLSGAKVVSKETAAPGDTLTYTLTLTNNGDVTSEDQTIQDTLVDVLPHIVESAAEISVIVTSNKDATKDATVTGTELIAGLTYDVVAGEIITVTFDVTIKDKEDLDLTNPITIENSAVVGESNPSTETEVEATDVTGTKTVSKETAAPGDTLTYTLTLSNSGNVTSENQTIKDTLVDVLPYIVETAGEIEVVVASSKDTSKNATITATELIAGLTYDVLAGETITVTFDVTIKDKEDLDLTDTITIENSAVVGESSPGTETEVESTDVTGTKTVSKETAAPGDTLTYTLTLRNGGNTKSENQTIKDTLVDVLPYIVETAGEIEVVVASNKDTSKNATITATELIAGLTYDVLAGETITVTFDVTIKDKEDLDLTSPITIENSAVVGESSPGTETEVEVTDVTGSKTVSKETATPGDTLTYTLTLSNSGNATSENQIIQDQLTNVLPYIVETAAQIFVTVSSNKDSSKNATVTATELAAGLTYDVLAGEVITVTFDVTIKDKEDLDLTGAITIQNSAIVGEDGPSTETEVESTDLIGTKSVSDANDDKKATPGELLTYTLTLKNLGNITATNQTIRDELGGLLPHIVESAEQISVVVSSNKDSAKNGIVTGEELITGLTYDVLAGEIITVVFNVTVGEIDLESITELTNIATIGKDTPSITIPTGDAILVGSKSVSKAEAEPGESLTYTITLSNNGDVDAEAQTIQDGLDNVLPHIVESAAAISVSVVSDLDSSKDATLAATDLINGLTYDVAAGETITVTFTVTIKDKTSLGDVAEISNSAIVGDDNPGTSTEILVTKLSGTKTVSKSIAEPGDTLTYTLTLSNSGNLKAEGQTIQDTLANVLPYIVESADEISVVVTSTDTTKNATVSGTELISGLSFDVAAGEAITVTFNVTVKDKEDLDLTDTITISNSAVVGENSPGTETEIKAADLVGTKTASKDKVIPGDTLTYTLTLSNNGNDKAEDQTIQDQLIGVLPYIVESAGEIVVTVSSDKDSSKDATLTGTELITGLTYDVAVGETITVTFDVTIDPDLDVTTVKKIENSAVVGKDNPSTSTETGKAELTGTKTASKDKVVPGDTLTYTLTLSNSGNAKAEAQTIQDELIGVLPYIVESAAEISVVVTSTDTTKNTTVTGTELITGLTYDVAIGETITVTFDVTIDPDLDVKAIKKIENSAVVGKDNPSTTTETGKAELTGTKSVTDENGDKKASPGEILTYTLTLSNSGSVKAEAQTIQDQLINVLPHTVESASEISVEVASTDTTKNTTVSGTELIAGLTYDVAAGETITVKFSVTIDPNLDVKAVKTIENSAVVGEDEPSTTTQTGKPELTGIKLMTDATGDGKANPGETLTYTLMLKNSGSVKAEAQMIQDKLTDLLPHIEDPRNNVVTVNQGGTISNTTVSELMNGLVFDVKAGETITVTFSVTVKSDLNPNVVTELKNSAVVGEDEPEITVEVKKPILVTLRYFANTDDETVQNIPEKVFEHTSGDEVTVHEVTPTREGYIFTHWEAKPALSRVSLTQKYLCGETFVIETHTEMYAQWVPVDSPEPANPPVTPPSTGVSNDFTLYSLGLLASAMLLLFNKKRKIKS